MWLSQDGCGRARRDEDESSSSAAQKIHGLTHGPHSVVNAGVLESPLGGGEVVGLVAAGGSQKLRNLRRTPLATIVARVGWRWAAVEGGASIIGPDDPLLTFDADAVRLLLRDIFRSAGGSHEDWDESEQVMAAERRAAVLITPRRVNTNPQA
jgi:hypothetical protein